MTAEKLYALEVVTNGTCLVAEYTIFNPDGSIPHRLTNHVPGGDRGRGFIGLLHKRLLVRP